MTDSATPSSGPPTTTGPLQKREARLAWGLLFPTIAIISAVVVLPLLAIFWISFKPIGLADLRQEGYEAFFFAIGAHTAYNLGIPGEKTYPR